MKRTITLTIIFYFTLCLATYAGILGATKTWLLDNALESVIALIFMIIAGFWGGKTWAQAVLKSKMPVKEAVDIYKRVREARRSSSPGGTAITNAERDEIFKEVEEFIASVIKAITGKNPQ